MNYKNILTSLFLVLSTSLSAQNFLLKQANDAMRDLDYMTAILLYQQVLEKDKHPEALINIAECYRKINDKQNAEFWYARVVQLPSAKPIHKLYYGMMLQANGKCEVAKAWLNQYVKDVPDDARGQHLARACEIEEELKSKSRGVYVINPMPFNSNLDDFAPVIIGDKIVFASDRTQTGPVKRTNMWTGSPFAELYAVSFKMKGATPGNFQYGEAEKFSKNISTKFHEAAAALSPDGRTIFFTRNNFSQGSTGKSDEGLVKLKIYAAQSDGQGGWHNETELPFNSNEYNVAHPTMSADGQRLYFSSNMPGGYGGMDLYVSTLENGVWGPPINLGPVVNTEGNEIFPYIDPNNRLYFASNGHIGLGGLDIYYSTPASNSGDSWNFPVNLGYPINTNADDFGITFGKDLTWGFFTSDRDGGAGRDDVYGFLKSAASFEVYVYDSNTKLPVSGATVVNSKTGLTMTTGPDGKIAFDMRAAECADFTVEKKNYEAASKSGCGDPSNPNAITRIEIPIAKQLNLYLQGIVFDMTDGYPAEDARVILTNNCGKEIPEAVFTGSDGRYKFKLDKECCYTVRAVKNGFIAGTADRICTNGLTKNSTLKSNLTLQPYLDGEGFIVAGKESKPNFNHVSGLYENRDGTPASFVIGNGLEVRNGILFDNGAPSKPERATWERGKEGFLVHLYYDYGQSNVNDESLPELEKLRKTLQENPDLQVEISSHTDSRGSDEYNLDLSQRRADWVVSWLVRQGIARERLVGKGYGESKLVNRCKDNIPCSETEHQLNRRTEFRVTGTGVTISQPKPNLKAGPCDGCPF
ncbi:MAG: PD40 domain-containing protein [Saprospiraceae bacterium]|nr:PD40 domain-containing protein [Saprospiraceae bacterium]